MKIIIISFLLACFVYGSMEAQEGNPVSWTFDAKKINADEYEVRLTATVEDEWHIYSKDTPKGGPVPTSISFTKNPLLVLNNGITENGKLEKRFEPLFNVDVMQYSGKVVFVQVVKMKGKVKTSLNGSVEYMTCNEHECMPPVTKRFSVALK